MNDSADRHPGAAPQGAPEPASPGSPSELGALVELLADPDPGVARTVVTRLEAWGEGARAALDRATRDSDPLRRTRARGLLSILQRRPVLARLRTLAGRRSVDLEQALWTLAELAAGPDELAEARAELDLWAERVLVRLTECESDQGFARPRMLSAVLAEEVGLTGATRDYHHPDNVQLHRAIARRCGLPLTLTAIYLFVARRCGLHAAPIAFPGHVLLRIYAGQRSMLIDPFDDGAARTRKECLSYLGARGLPPRPDWFEDADDATMFQRQLLNLANSHRMRGRRAEADELAAVAGIVAERKGLHPSADPESA